RSIPADPGERVKKAAIAAHTPASPASAPEHVSEKGRQAEDEASGPRQQVRPNAGGPGATRTAEAAGPAVATASAEPLSRMQTPTPPTEARADARAPSGTGKTIEGTTGPWIREPGSAGGGGGRRGDGGTFHKRLPPQSFEDSLRNGVAAVRANLVLIMLMTLATNMLILAIPVYLFQISD